MASEGEMLPAAAAPPLDDENLLSEILLRLPPLPSSLPRASAVCKRWLSLVSDRGFIRRFRLRHRRNPPLLGLFRPSSGSISFEPTMEPPNRVRFSSPIYDGDSFTLLGCRHGLVLIFHSSRGQVLVWDPVTGDQHRVATPLGMFKYGKRIDGTVLRAAGDAHHFQVVLLGYEKELNPRASVCIYSSETCLWSNLISTPVPGDAVCYGKPPVLVGNIIYWLLSDSSSVILEVDLDTQSAAVTLVPTDMFPELQECHNLMVIRAEGGLGLLSLVGYTAQLWKRKTGCDGVASWMLGRTIELDRLLHLNSQKYNFPFIMMIAYAEENNVAFLRTFAGIFMVRLESLEFRKKQALVVNVMELSTICLCDVRVEQACFII
ncbi:unnamed protein product [Alopecurus aequalis]